MFVNAFDLPERNNGIVHFPGSPRQYRADCKAGIFKIGETDMLGKSIQMEVLAYHSFNAELFNYQYQQWLEVFFVDKDNTVSQILFKTESIANFLELMRKLAAINRPLGSQIVTVKTAKRSNDNGTYYVVEFERNNNKVERSKQLAEFVNSNINGIYSGRSAHTFEKGNKTNEISGENKPEKLIEPSEEGEEF